MNPTMAQQKESDMEIFITGTEKAIMMVEGGAQEVPEDEVLGAILEGHRAVQPLIQLQHKLREMVGVKKREFTPAPVD
ncbi:polyribonucleotide nucleotidyltransferase, partial [Devosia neptuniae]|nr:polyribonucleotide nucleotidyltransferase [Devosia neptuniae]